MTPDSPLLQALTRDELLGIADHFSMTLADRRAKAPIREACLEAGAPTPTIEVDGGLRLSWKWQVFDDAPPRTEDAITEATDPVADPVADPVGRLLQRLRAGPLAPSRLQAELGLKHRPTSTCAPRWPKG